MTQRPDGQKSKLPARVHPDERGRIETLNSLNRQFHGAPQEKPPTSYYTPILIQCTLPHSDPQSPTWVKTNGDYSLILASGADEKGEFIGLPYGSFPRLVLAFIITRVIQTGERRIELSSHFSSFLKEIGYTSNHRGNGVKGQRVREQLIRLLRASITFQQKNDSEGHLSVMDVKIAPKFELWFDVRNPVQGSLWGSYLTISEEFREAILRAPVPLRTDVIAALKKSPLALDVYMWVTYRLFTLQATGQEDVSLSYGRLQEQFGTGIAEENYRLFRSRFKQSLAEVAKYWLSPNGDRELLHYDLDETRLVLYRSPLLIAKAKPSTAQDEAARILAIRKFDDFTMKKARQVAGNKWDVRWLETQYFEWIEQNAITPKNPRAHFLNFIKTHRERHGETV